MPYTYSASEYKDMVSCYYSVGGNNEAARRKYQVLYPSRTLPSHRTFFRAAQRLRDWDMLIVPNVNAGRPRRSETSRHEQRVSSPEEHFNIQDSSSDSLIDDPSEDNHEASADKIRCPKCSSEIEMKQYVQDRVNAILVNVYRYFATEGTELSPSQLRERTALCTGASEADVECALVLHQEVSATQKPLRKPPRKRRKKESKSPPPIQEEEPYIERETLIVTVDPKAGDANSEINPLAIKEEQPSSPITCEQDASFCEPQQSVLKPKDMAKVFVKTEPTEEPNTERDLSQSSQPERSSAVGPTPDIPPDTYFMIKNEEIDIEDNCGSDPESEEGYS